MGVGPSLEAPAVQSPYPVHTLTLQGVAKTGEKVLYSSTGKSYIDSNDKNGFYALPSWTEYIKDFPSINQTTPLKRVYGFTENIEADTCDAIEVTFMATDQGWGNSGSIVLLNRQPATLSVNPPYLTIAEPSELNRTPRVNQGQQPQYKRFSVVIRPNRAPWLFSNMRNSRFNVLIGTAPTGGHAVYLENVELALINARTVATPTPAPTSAPVVVGGSPTTPPSSPPPNVIITSPPQATVTPAPQGGAGTAAPVTPVVTQAPVSLSRPPVNLGVSGNLKAPGASTAAETGTLASLTTGNNLYFLIAVVLALVVGAGLGLRRMMRKNEDNAKQKSNA